MRNATKRVLLLALASGLIGSAARADIVTTDPSLPPTSSVDGGQPAYLSPSDVHAMYTGGALTLILSKIEHSGFSNIKRDTVPGTNDEVEHFDSTVTGLVSVNGSPDVPISLTGPVTVVCHGKAGTVTGTFDTEMTELSLSGNTPLGLVMIRESPTLASLGQTSITDLGGGLYRVGSFFDVFTELSIDGGMTWIPSSGSTHVDLRSVPEPSTFALFGIGAMGLAIHARRRRSRRV